MVLALALAASVLPSAWEGRWVGDMHSSSPRVPAKIEMELEVKPLADGKGHTWTIVYRPEGREDRRPYEIRPVDGQAGRYVIDEKNGIVLDASLRGSVLVSTFSVGDTLLATRYELSGTTLRVEMDSYRLSDARETKAGAQSVKSYRLVSQQTATLARR